MRKRKSWLQKSGGFQNDWKNGCYIVVRFPGDINHSALKLVMTTCIACGACITKRATNRWPRQLILSVWQIRRFLRGISLSRHSLLCFSSQKKCVVCSPLSTSNLLVPVIFTFVTVFSIISLEPVTLNTLDALTSDEKQMLFVAGQIWETP